MCVDGLSSSVDIRPFVNESFDENRELKYSIGHFSEEFAKAVREIEGTLGNSDASFDNRGSFVFREQDAFHFVVFANKEHRIIAKCDTGARKRHGVASPKLIGCAMLQNSCGVLHRGNRRVTHDLNNARQRVCDQVI